METPSAVEGTWALLDADGKTIANSEQHPGATLVVSPYFYRGQYSQSLLRTHVVGKRGRKVRQTVKVSAAAGKVSAESVDKAPKPVEPSFDKASPSKQPPPKPIKPAE